MSNTAAPISSLDRLLPFWTQVFGVPASVFTGVWSAVPENRRRTFFHTEEGRLLATVQVYLLPVNGAAIGAVANVATLESARGQGLSTGLLREAIRWMEAEGVGISTLYTGKPHHYARLGWMPFEERVRRVESEATPIAPGEPDLERMRSIYTANLAPFAMIRDEAWWNGVVAPRLLERQVWMGENAYLVASRGDELTIDEAVGDPAELRGLILGATAWAGGRATLHGDLDLGTPGARSGGMIRGGLPPAGDWFSVLDHF